MLTLNTLANQAKARIQSIEDRAAPEPSLSEEDILEGRITEAYEANDSFLQFTGFHRDMINHWVDLMVPFALNARKRGPQPRSSLSDALLCYLTMLCLPADQPMLAKTLGLKEAQFAGNVDRVRPILNEALKTKWPEMAPSPLEDNERGIYEAGLLVDTTTVECFKPKGRFGESKHYFDAHHWVYGLKTEIAVTSARPHVMVAKSPHSPGSVSDYEIHKKNYTNYLPYLRKSAEERHESAENGDDFPFWAVIGDKMYIGPVADTQPERRITPKKGHHLSQQEKKRNKDVSRERNPVEWFFGRLYRKFPLFNGIYKFDHSNFDIDFENACLLINEDITVSELALTDGEFYQKFLDERMERFKAQEKKRKANYQKYNKNKASKLAKVQRYVVDDS